MHQNNTKDILFFFGKSLVVYFIVLIVIRLAPIKEHFILQMNNLLNLTLTDVLPKTKVFFHTANNTQRSFKLDKAILPCPPLNHLGEFDTQAIFVNTTHFSSQLDNKIKDPGSKLVIQNYKSRMSIWDIVWMPLILIISLSLCYPGSFKRKFILLSVTGITILVIGLIRCYCILVIELLNAPVLERLYISEALQKLIQFIAGLQGIEFIYISSFIVWVIGVLVLTPFINQHLEFKKVQHIVSV